MARARMLKPSFFTNEALSALPSSARLLFCGLWTIADREGRLEDRPSRIKVELLPYDRVNVDVLLQKLHDAGFIVRYESERGRVIQVVNFTKHQNPHKNEPPSSLPTQEISRAAQEMPDPPRVGSGIRDQGSKVPPSAGTAAPSPRQRFFDTSSLGKQNGALIDEARAHGYELDANHTGGMLKRYPKGAVWDALLKAQGDKAANYESRMESVLSDGGANRRTGKRAPSGHHGGDDDGGADEHPASPFAGMGRQAGSSGGET